MRRTGEQGVDDTPHRLVLGVHSPGATGRSFRRLDRLDEGFRADVIVNGLVILEFKSVEQGNKV